MVDQFLSFFLSQDACCDIFFNINIKESRNTSDTHSCTVLCLDGSQISEVQPLNCFFCILSRLGNIISVRLSHFFHFLQCTNLICDLFTKLEVSTTHTLTVCSSEICFLFLDQVIDTVQSHTTVIAYNTSASVSIRKTSQDLVVTCFQHFRCIDIKYTLVMCFMIFCKDFMKLRTWFISIHFTGFFSHFNSAVWHECTFQRLVCLQTDNLLQIFHAVIDISSSVCSDACYNISLHIKNAAFCSFFFLKLRYLSPQTVCCFCRSLQERIISIIRCVVILNKVADIYAFFPESSSETVPLFKILHVFYLPFFIIKLCVSTFCRIHLNIAQHVVQVFC